VSDATAPNQPLLTNDGRPLKDALQQSLRRSKIKALGLIAIPFLFLVIVFAVPVFNLLVKSFDDNLINEVLPRTFEIYEDWPGEDLPDEAHYEAMFLDLTGAEGIQIGKASTRMNYDKSKWKSLIKKSARKFKKIEGGPYKDAMIKIDKKWGDVTFWQSLGSMKDPYTFGYYLNAVDLRYNHDKTVRAQPENRRIYKMLWGRTLLVSLIVTLLCLILAYPVSHLLATLPLRYSNLLMICVLMPFWTSLLVRIVALAMMYNFTGTIIVMTQILLPFMILPIYSVMRTISPNYMKAAQNLGASPALAFLKVYMPLTIPGVGAGVILVFIVAIGYYITPELVGGKDGQLIGNQIAYHLKSSLNWGLASAMGVMLLAGILILYWCYDKIVGIDNMRMG